MADPVFQGELALLEALPGGDALATLHLARLASGPVLLAQTFGNPSAAQPGWTAAVAAARALAEPKTTALLPVVHAQGAPQPALAYRLFASLPLSAILLKSQQDGMPIAADLALLIAERTAEALGKLPPGTRHTLLTAASVLVGFEGEVAVIDAPLSAALAGRALAAAELGDWRAARLHKSALAGKPTPRAEIWQIGAMLLEMVGGEPFSTGGDIASTIARLCQAQEVPADVQEVIERCLVENADAFRTVDEMKQAAGKLIYQGAYNPSSFNLAYFIHTLFRGEDEAFAARVKSFAALPLEFPAAPAKPEKKVAPAKPKAPPPALSFGTVTGGDEGGPPPADLPLPPPVQSGGKGILVGGAVAVIGLAVGGWLMWSKMQSKNAELERQRAALAAQQAQVAQEQAKLDAAKNEAAELQKKEEALKRLAAEAKTTAEKKKAEEEAARLTEQRKKAEEKSKQLQASVQEKEQAVQQAATVKPKTIETPSPPASPPASAVIATPGGAAHPVSPPAESAPLTTAPPSPAEPIKEIYSPAEVDIPASLKADVKPEYPSKGHGNATVIVRCTVDVSGAVVDAAVAKGDESGLGFNEAALEAARKLRYAPAIKNGRPVKSYSNKTYLFKG